MSKNPPLLFEIVNIFFYRAKRLTLYFFLFLSLLLSFYTSRNQEIINKMSDLVGVLLSPFSKTYQVVTEFSSKSYENIGNFFIAFDRIGELENENRRLKEEIDILGGYARENRALKATLGFVTEHKYKPISAKLISNQTNLFNSILKIDQGVSAQIKKNDIVISENMLVGRVLEVESDQAGIISIFDPSSRVPVISVLTGNKLIAAGNGSGALEGRYFDINAKFEIGEALFSLKENNYFPENILLGYVSAFDGEELIIEPAIKLHKIDLVSVITNF